MAAANALQPLNPIRGAHRILRFFAGVARKDPALAAMAARPATVNGLRASYCAKAISVPPRV
jgi:hypothetical protein